MDMVCDVFSPCRLPSTIISVTTCRVGLNLTFLAGHRDDDNRNPTRMMRDESSFELFNPDGHSCLLQLQLGMQVKVSALLSLTSL